MNQRTLYLHVFAVDVALHAEPRAYTLLHANFGFMSGPGNTPALEYVVADVPGARYQITTPDQRRVIAEDDADLLFIVEKEMTIELQKLRRDLYFLHGAALEYRGNACLIVAPSGSGKSTTTWALLHHGLRYLSDELAPVDLQRLEVAPYPHALNLKRDPPAPYALPGATLRTAHTLHVPVAALPAAAVTTLVPLTAIFFLRYTPDRAESTLRPASAAEAGARLYANTLNLLAHPGGGIDAGIAIARRCRNYNVDSKDLTRTCELIRDALDESRTVTH